MRMKFSHENYMISYEIICNQMRLFQPGSFYCARVIMRYGDPFDFDSISLPLELQSFIASHSAQGKLKLTVSFCS